MNTANQWQNKYTLPVFVTLVLSVSFFLRLYALDEYPMQVNHDELSNVYDAWSITETGADRSGRMYPALLRGFGDQDYRPSLYA